MSQIVEYPASVRADKRVHRVKRRRTLRLPRIPFWPGAIVFALAGSALVVTLCR